MSVRRWCVVAALAGCWLLAGCKIVQGKIEKPATPAVASRPSASPSVTSATAPAPTAAPTSTAMPAPAAALTTAGAAEPAPKAEAKAASKAETKDEPKPAVEEKEAVSSEGAADALLSATKAALDQATRAAGANQRRTAAEAQRKAHAERRAGWIKAAQAHQRYLAVHITNHDTLRAATHLALMGSALEAVRGSLGGEPAWDEMNFALSALYSVTKESGSEDAVVKTAQEHLRRALEMLPAPTAKPEAGALPSEGQKEPASSLSETDPASSESTSAPAASLYDPAALAGHLTAAAELLAKNHLQGRKRLQEIVLACSDSTALEALDLVEVSRRWLAEALGRSNWVAAKRNAERLAASLDELVKVVAPELVPATPPTASGSAPAEGSSSQAPATDTPSTASAAPAPPAHSGKSAEPGSAPAHANKGETS